MMVSNADSRTIRDKVEQGEVFFDERENEHYSVVDVRKNGVTLTREDREYYIPYSIFAQWYTRPGIKQINDSPATSPE